MTGQNRYRTCASVARSSVAGMGTGLEAALARADLAEVRLDFLRPEHVPDALEAIKNNLGRTVCTLRPRGEGGKFSGNEKERRSILRLIAEYGPFLLDVEYNTLRRDAALAKYLGSTGTGLLVSWHDFARTPGRADLEERLGKMARFSPNVKIVGTAKSASDSARMLELYGAGVAGVRNLISFAMGDPGRFSRILCLYLGSPYTYVSLGKPVAPGQFGADEMRRILNLGRGPRGRQLFRV